MKKILILILCCFGSFALHATPTAPPTIQQQEAPPAAKPTPPALEQPPPLPIPEPSTFLEPTGASYESAFLKMLFTLGGLILLVFLTIWILRRLSQGKFRGLGGGRTIEILEKRPLSNKSMLYLIQIGTKQVLISESQFDVRRIVSLDELAEVETED